MTLLNSNNNNYTAFPQHYVLYFAVLRNQELYYVELKILLFEKQNIENTSALYSFTQVLDITAKLRQVLTRRTILPKV